MLLDRTLKKTFEEFLEKVYRLDMEPGIGPDEKSRAMIFEKLIIVRKFSPVEDGPLEVFCSDKEFLKSLEGDFYVYLNSENYEEEKEK